MSQLTSKFESETGLVAMYRKGGADYHTLRYVNWLEAAVEKFNSALRQPTQQGSEPAEICAHHISGSSCPFTTFNIECGPLACKLSPRKHLLT